MALFTAVEALVDLRALRYVTARLTVEFRAVILRDPDFGWLLRIAINLSLLALLTLFLGALLVDHMFRFIHDRGIILEKLHRIRRGQLLTTKTRADDFDVKLHAFHFVSLGRSAILLVVRQFARRQAQ